MNKLQGKYNLNQLYKQKNNIYKAIIILITSFSILALTLKLDRISQSTIDKSCTYTNKLARAIVELRMSFVEPNWTWVVIFFVLYYMFFTLLRREYNKRIKISSTILALFFSFFSVIGMSYSKVNSWGLVFGSKISLFKSLILFIGFYFLLYCSLLFIFTYVFSHFNNILVNKEISWLTNNRKSFVVVTIIIFLSYLPYLIIMYPGCMNMDTRDQIAQVLNDISRSFTAKSVNLLSDSCIINNHHPVFYTLIIGIFVKLGKLINNMSISFEIYCIIQSLIISMSYSFVLWYMAKKKVHKNIRIGTLVFFALWPLNGLYAVTVMKDSIFSILILLGTIILYEILHNPKLILNSWKKKALISLYLLLLMLIRNNGLYMIILVLPFLIYMCRENCKDLIITFGVPIFLYVVVVSKVIFSVFNITQGSPREMLSIPFQQTARYAIEWGDTLSESDVKIVENILAPNDNIEVMKKRYTPRRSDAIKDKFNKNATREELKEYFIVWGKGLLKHPSTYIQATLNNMYSYFYFENDMFLYYNGITVEDMYGMHNYKGFDKYREAIKQGMYIIQKSPILSWSVNIGFGIWLILICCVYLIIKKKYKTLISYGFIISNLLICVAGPIVYMRYAIPMIVCIPLIFAYCSLESDKY